MYRKLLAVLLAPALAFALTACDVDKEEAGRAPDVDVEVDPGELPEYDIEPAEVEVGTETREVTVPDVDVDTETKEIEVPTIDIEDPDEPE